MSLMVGQDIKLYIVGFLEHTIPAKAPERWLPITC